MSRLLSITALWLLLLFAAQPASGVMSVQPRNGTWEMAADGYDLALDVRDGPNLYAYVRQNPWTAFDPKGLSLKVPKNETKKVEAFMTKHGVSGHTVKNDGKLWGSKDTISGSAKVTGATTDALTSEIIAKMISSDREFSFNDFAGLEKNVGARKTGVETALGIKAQYSMTKAAQNGGAANGNFSKTGWMNPNAGKSYLEAIEGCLNSSDAVIDCTKSCYLPLQVGALKQGDTIDVGKGVVSEAGTMRRDSANKRDWIPGDWGYLDKFGQSANYRGGENILYVGDGKWRGHNSSESRNPDPTFFTQPEIDTRDDVMPMRRFPSVGISP